MCANRLKCFGYLLLQTGQLNVGKTNMKSCQRFIVKRNEPRPKRPAPDRTGYLPDFIGNGIIIRKFDLQTVLSTMVYFKYSVSSSISDTRISTMAFCENNTFIFSIKSLFKTSLVKLNYFSLPKLIKGSLFDRTHLKIIASTNIIQPLRGCGFCLLFFREFHSRLFKFNHFVAIR